LVDRKNVECVTLSRLTHSLCTTVLSFMNFPTAHNIRSGQAVFKMSDTVSVSVFLYSCIALFTLDILNALVKSPVYRIPTASFTKYNRKLCTAFCELERDDAMFKFGIIADIQYAAEPDALNFQKTKLRKYKQSLDIYRSAIQYWISLSNTKQNRGLSFLLVLGKLLL
jgi:hypothetical protein